MKRLIRIGLCLLITSLPLAGLQAQPSRCADGIGAATRCGAGARAASAQDGCCCCPDPAGCYCQAPARPVAPSAGHAAVPPPAHSPDDVAVLVHAAQAPAESDSASLVVGDSHPIQVHPEKLLARLHVLQI